MRRTDIVTSGHRPVIIFPLVPVIFFFLANALIIGMVSRSFKELSFISIFFSTVATSYLFFPSIFANVHVISLISPLTLIVLTIQGSAWTITDYLYSTSLFWLTGAVLFYIGARNFKDERLFSEKRLVSRVREFLSEILSQKYPFISLFLLKHILYPLHFHGAVDVPCTLFQSPHAVLAGVPAFVLGID